jgi:tRNA modification GTPase
MYSLDDTIAAISTPVGEGGIGIVRMSGPESVSILRRLFVSGSGSTVQRSLKCTWNLEPRVLHYGHIVDPNTTERVDEVLAAYMPAPRTFTRQDVVEINGHGGIVALRQILGLCLRHGARMAETGEFTARAFLNGRLDLAQAEAVLDVVQAKTEKSLHAAVDQLAGRLSEQVRSVRAILVDVLAYLEASIDFVEDEIPERDIEPNLAQVAARLTDLLSSADQGIIYRQGVRAAIVGRPNVGKSSLLNRLLRTSRAIVTDIPGTTRDTLEETLNLQGVPVILVDTAGIIDATADPIERLGIERSRSALSQADLALLVVDASQPITSADRDIAALVGDKPAIVVVNKMDLIRSTIHHPFPAIQSMLNGGNWKLVSISALTGAGLEALEDTIVETVFSGRVAAAEAPLVTSPRHKDALSRALDHVQAAIAAHRASLSPDLIAIDVAAAVNVLGEVTGQTASEDLVEAIFGNFCIGK